MDHNKIANDIIVVGIDTSRESGLALEWAAHEAARRRVALQILHAYSPDYPTARAGVPGDALPTDPSDVMESLAERACADATATVRALHPTLDVRTRTEPGTPGGALVEASRTAGMVVVGARGLGAVRSVLLGSVSIHVAAHVQCPVVVVREAATRTLADARVIVGVDGHSYSTGAIRFAFEQAAARGVGLTVVHTWQLDSVEGAAVANAWAVDWERLDVQERSLLSESIVGFQEQFPTVDVRRHVVQRHPVEELVRLSENACLLVVGTRGRGSVAGLIEGSVSQGVLRRAHCPVAVVHPPVDAPVEAGGRHDIHLPAAPDA
jgi:nucleotide-binding universal stress UspA family protein